MENIFGDLTNEIQVNILVINLKKISNTWEVYEKHVPLDVFL